MRMLSVVLALGGAASALAQPCAPAPPGLSAWFTFDEPAFGGAGVRKTAGVVAGGSALRFNGVSEYFAMPAPQPGLSVGEGDFTVELWIRTTDRVRTRNVVEYRNSEPRGYLIFVRAGAAGFQVADGPHIANAVAKSVPIADGRWHHLAGVVKRLPPQSPSLYVDGVPQSEPGRRVTLGNLDHHEPLWIARHRKNPLVPRDSLYFAGDVDELSVYRRALSPREIAAIHRAGAAGKCRPSVR